MLTIALAQQLQVVPSPSALGAPVEITVRVPDEQPIAAAIVHAEQPDGAIVLAGATDARGTVSFVPSMPGDHVFATEVAGVRLLAAHRVLAQRSRWPMAFGCIPLGLAALWSLSRARGRRDS